MKIEARSGRRIIPIVTAIVSLFTFNTALSAATAQVHVGPNSNFMSYSPAGVSVSTGDTVQWIWDSTPHSVTSGSPGPTSGQLFDSGTNHNVGDTFSHTFDAVGDVPYYCTVHGAAMSGTVKVTAASTPTPTATPTPVPSTTPTPIPRIGKGPIAIELQNIATGLNAPNDLVTAGDGSDRLFVVQQTGQISIIKNGQLQTAPFLDVSTRLVTLNPAYDERGLLGLAFHPDFNNPASPGYRKLYTYTTEPTVPGTADFTVPVPSDFTFNNQCVVAEWQVSAINPDIVDPLSRREVLRIDHPQSNHNAGKMAFRPADGYLYIAVGDGGGKNDGGDAQSGPQPGHNPAIGNGQDNTVILGKILRIDPLDPALTATSADPISVNKKYRIPASNPFVANPAIPENVREIYAYGFRNPFRFSFDVASDRLIVGDVGQNNVEEVDIVENGKNYGWRKKEGTLLFNPADGSVTPDPSPDPSLIDPIAEYMHPDGLAILGGLVANGNSVPALSGKYVFGDYSTGFTSAAGRLFYADLGSSKILEPRIGVTDRPLGQYVKGIGQDANGDMFALVDSNGGPAPGGGQVLKIVSLAAEPALVNLSTRMRVETGDNVLIGGFILTGSAPKSLVLRAIGPSLRANGQPVPGTMPNPLLELHDGSGALIATNGDWMDDPGKQTIIDKGLAPSNSLESAHLASLQPGNYTAIVRDATGASGVGLVELYDIDQNTAANAVNISTRGHVLTEDNVMIGGFIVGGTQPRKVVVRAIGPELTARGVADVLQDPTLELHDGSGATIESNDNWRSDHEAEIQATGLAPTNDNESAIVKTLAPGNYTAIVRGAGGSTGVGLVEVYQLASGTATE